MKLHILSIIFTLFIIILRLRLVSCEMKSEYEKALENFFNEENELMFDDNEERYQVEIESFNDHKYSKIKE